MSADLPSHPVVPWKYCSTDRAELTFRQCTCTTAGRRRSKTLGSPKVERRSPHERAWVHRRITSKITTDSPVGDLTRRPFICRPTPWLRQEFARMFQQVLAEFTRPHFTLPPQREHSLTITSRIIPPPCNWFFYYALKQSKHNIQYSLQNAKYSNTVQIKSVKKSSKTAMHTMRYVLCHEIPSVLDLTLAEKTRNRTEGNC